MPSSIEPRAVVQQAGPPRLADTAIELAGVACIAAFFWFVWSPAPLVVIGLYLLVGGNLRATRPRPAGRPHWSERLARAVAAYRGSP